MWWPAKLQGAGLSNDDDDNDNDDDDNNDDDNDDNNDDNDNDGGGGETENVSQKVNSHCFKIRVECFKCW